MPPREEYRQLSVETLDWMLSEVRRNHDDILIMKTERRIVSATYGSLFGIMGSVAAELVIHYFSK